MLGLSEIIANDQQVTIPPSEIVDTAELIQVLDKLRTDLEGAGSLELGVTAIIGGYMAIDEINLNLMVNGISPLSGNGSDAAGW